MDFSSSGPMLAATGPAAAGAPSVAEFPGEGIGHRVAAKNAAARLGAILKVAPPSTKELASIDKELRMVGGKRQRGGATSAENLAFVKAIAMMMLYTSGKLAESAAGRTKEYIRIEIVEPLLGPGSRLARIALSLVEEGVIRAPVTVVSLSGAGLGYTANFAAKLIQKFNTWGRATSQTLLSDKAAKDAADAAVRDVNSLVKTAAVGLFAANQIGIAPLSSLLAAIIYSLKITGTTGTGRAYFVSSFYAWYVTRPKAEQVAIDESAKEYADAARSAATQGGEAVKAAVEAAVSKLGPMLAKKAESEPAAKPEGAVAVTGKDAIEVVAAASGVAPAAVPAVEALKRGAPAAAVAINEQEKQSAPVDYGVAPPIDEFPPAAAEPLTAGPPAPAAAEPLTAATPTPDSVEDEGKVSGRPTRRTRSGEVLTAAKAAQDKGTGVLPTPRTSARLKKTEGGRKTRGKKSKRRVTRRKSRKTTTMKFAY